MGGRVFSRSGHWRALSRSGHWRIRSPLMAGQGNQGRRRAGWDQREGRREERVQLEFQLSLPVNQIPLHVQQSQMYNQLTLSHGAGGGAPLRAHTAPSWWALSPALAPDLTCWAQLPGRSSAQSLGFALARRSWREMALRHRWARADALHRGEMVGWALGLEWIWRDHSRERW